MTEVSAVSKLLGFELLPLQTRLDTIDVALGWRPAARVLIPIYGEIEAFAAKVLESGCMISVGRGVKLQRRVSATQCIDWFESLPVAGGTHGLGLERMSILYIGRSETEAEQARAADESGDDESFGRALGYPRCCMSFVRNRSRVPSIAECFELYASDGFYEPWTWPCTLQFDAGLIPHFPCSSSCGDSRILAEQRWNLLREAGRSTDIDRLRRARRGKYFLATDNTVGRVDPDGQVPSSASATALPTGEFP